MLTPSGNVHERVRDVSDEETSETLSLISRGTIQKFDKHC